MKQTITEEQLKAIISESVKKVLDEIGNTSKGQDILGRLAARKQQQMGQTFNDGMNTQDPEELQKIEALNTKQGQERDYIEKYAAHQRNMAPYGSDLRNDKYGKHFNNGYMNQYERMRKDGEYIPPVFPKVTKALNDIHQNK